MDIAADRFLALSGLSASLWSRLDAGQAVPDVIDNIAAVRGISACQAETLVFSQLRSWQTAGLINSVQPLDALPQPKPSTTIPPRDLSPNAIDSARLVPSLTASLFFAEWVYRRALVKTGLARTILALQAERGRLVKPHDLVVHQTMRSYHACRRLFKQGSEARDCLVRSLALAAVLKRHGVDADLCIGIVDLPFSSHAWVECATGLVNETRSNSERYAIIARY